MVQLEPNMHATLHHAARCGATVPVEALAAMEHSLPLKRAAAGVRTLTLWGRLTARNGRDYFIAEGDGGAARARGERTELAAKYFFSQDGARWADLPTVDAAAAAICARVRTMLTGDPAHQWPVPPPPPGSSAAAADPAAEGDAAAAAATAGSLVSEVQRLRAMVDGINALAAVQPAGCWVADAHGRLVPNKLFAGAAHPSKLESYQHRADAAEPGASLARDVRGSWAVRSDALKGVTTLRSLLYPGYAFYYDARAPAWGAFYHGDGLRNDDLAFML